MGCNIQGQGQDQMGYLTATQGQVQDQVQDTCNPP